MSSTAVEDNPVASSRTGLERAAIVLLGLGDQLAARILQQMPAKSVMQLMQVLPKVNGVVESELESIMDGLLAETEDAPLFVDKSGMSQAMRKALGEKRASELLQSAQGAEYGEVLEKLLMLDAKLIARLIAHEHHQLQAITLACLDAGKSAAVLNMMPEDVQVDITHRLARLSSVPTSSLEAVAGLLDGLTEQEVSTYAVHGVGQLAEVLNHMDADTGDELLESLRGNDGELANQVASLRFTFDHVLEMEMEALRILVENADSDILAIALRGVPLAKQEHVYSCLGRRAAAALRDEVDSGVSMRVSRVNEARVQLTALARRLSREGQIELVSSTEEMVG
ncbi:MAG: FliG C-terminal domain-containing protein [Endozoicomonas sp.]